MGESLCVLSLFFSRGGKTFLYDFIFYFFPFLLLFFSRWVVSGFPVGRFASVGRFFFFSSFSFLFLSFLFLSVRLLIFRVWLKKKTLWCIGVCLMGEMSFFLFFFLSFSFPFSWGCFSVFFLFRFGFCSSFDW